MNTNEEFKILLRFLGEPLCLDDRLELCAQLGVSQTTLYRMLEKLKDRPIASSLERSKPGPKEGMTRLSAEAEEFLEHFILTKHFVRQRPRISKSYLRLIEACDNRGLPVPSESTFRRRVARVTLDQERRGFYSARERSSKFSDKTAHFIIPKPMELAAIDHTKLNVLLVSSVDGSVLGRPIFTVVTDICTRLVTGFHVDFHGPSYLNVAASLAHAVYDKNEYLKEVGIEGVWPVTGIPKAIQMDNAKEFKSKAMTRGCGEYGIDRIYRPKGKAHFGGHVESLVGTLNDNLRNVPGATFANWIEKADYPSEKLACFTLPMIEKYITNHIVNFYHKAVHKELECSPIQKFSEFVRAGFVPRLSPKSREEFMVDFKENTVRQVRDLGIEFECKQFWSPRLNDLYNRKVKSVRVIPVEHDVTVIDVVCPDGSIIRVPAKNTTLPKITRREWKRYRAIVNQRNRSTALSNREIAHFIRIEYEIEHEAKVTTKRVRKAQESQHLAAKKDGHVDPVNDRTEAVTFDPSAVFKTSKSD